MSLAKLTIKPESASGLKEVKVMFNPNTYSVAKTVRWIDQGDSDGEDNPSRRKNAPAIQFGGGESRTLTLELFFDTTDETDESKIDVRNQTNQIVMLTRIVRKLDPLRPPVCQVSWGKEAPQGWDFPFTGVITQLTQHFNLFKDDGRPLRATLNVSFREWLDATKDQKKTDPEFTTRLIKRGDTLSSIAAELYSDPAQWRTIAQANQLDDPRRIPVGLRLNIPKTR